MTLNKIAVVTGLLLALIGSPAGAMYKCQNSSGQIEYRDSPCAGDQMETKLGNAREPDEGSHAKPRALGEDVKLKLITAFASALGKRVDMSDPKWVQAAEALLVADAGKAYAFTKIHAVGLEFCPGDRDLTSALDVYRRSVSKYIELGHYYYINGIDIAVGPNRMQKSGKELRDALDGLIRQKEAEFRSGSADWRRQQCKEATEALRFLANVYSE